MRIILPNGWKTITKNHQWKINKMLKTCWKILKGYGQRIKRM